MRILFVGALWDGSTGRQRMMALRDLGHEVVEVNTTPPTSGNQFIKLIKKILRKLEISPEIIKANHAIERQSQQEEWDILWLDKATEISPKTIRSVISKQKQCRVIFYTPDNMSLRGNQTKAYNQSIPYYDLFVTTKSHDVTALKQLGARDVLFIQNAYDPHTHRPIALTDKEKEVWSSDVGFIGGFEVERYQAMLQLANAGIPVTVRGPGWERYLNSHPKLHIKPGWVFGDDYAKMVCATKINLGLLRKAAQDKQTTRSIEIPACGGFMLAERTDEHLQLFEEGQEAEFFDNIEELIGKTQYYLAHDDERERIAWAGRERCLNSGYSNQERLSTVLTYLDKALSPRLTRSSE